MIKEGLVSLLRNSEQFVAVQIDLNGNLLSANAKFKKIVGEETATDGNRVDFFSTFNKADIHLLKVLMEEADLENLACFTVSLRYAKLPCLNSLIFDWEFHPLKENGSVVGYTGIGIETTAQNTTALVLESVLDSSMDACVVIDRNWRILYFNKAALEETETFGIELKNNISLKKIVPARILNQIKVDIKNALNGKLSTLDISDKTGNQIKNFNLEFRPVIYMDNPICITITARECTDLKTYAQQLKASKALYGSLVESQTDLLVRVNVDSEITFVNDIACETYSFSKEDVIGKKWTELINRDNLIPSTQNQEQISTSQEEMTFIYQSITKDNSRIWHEWSAIKIKNDQTDSLEYQWVGKNISETVILN